MKNIFKYKKQIDTVKSDNKEQHPLLITLLTALTYAKEKIKTYSPVFLKYYSIFFKYYLICLKYFIIFSKFSSKKLLALLYVIAEFISFVFVYLINLIKKMGIHIVWIYRMVEKVLSYLITMFPFHIWFTRYLVFVILKTCTLGLYRVIKNTLKTLLILQNFIIGKTIVFSIEIPKKIFSIINFVFYKICKLVKITYSYFRSFYISFLYFKNTTARFLGATFIVVAICIVFYVGKNRFIPNDALPTTPVFYNTLNKTDILYENDMLKKSYYIDITVRTRKNLRSILNMYVEDNKNKKKLMKVLQKIISLENYKDIYRKEIIFELSGGYSDLYPTYIKKMEIKLNPEKSIVAEWEPSKQNYKAQNVTYALIPVYKIVSGTITGGSFYQSLRDKGVHRDAILEMIKLFSFDFNFQQDVKNGDTYEIAYTDFMSAKGDTVRSGNIRFAEVIVNGDRKRYYRYKDLDSRVDYYDAQGVSSRKLIMKTPIEGARLSSSFGMRKHPVLGYSILHKGTDFAAPYGTPIFAAGDGVIDYAGRLGAFGIYVRIKHAGQISTAYAHTSRLARGIRRGVNVQQGQVIAYVGSTGRSTGDHLHFEVLKGWKQVDPNKIKLPFGKRLEGVEYERFRALIAPLIK